MKDDGIDSENPDLVIFKDMYAQVSQDLSNTKLPEDIQYLYRVEKDSQGLLKDFKKSKLFINHCTRKYNVSLRMAELGQDGSDALINTRVKEKVRGKS